MNFTNKKIKLIALLSIIIISLFIVGGYFIFIKKDTSNDQPQNTQEKDNYQAKKDNDKLNNQTNNESSNDKNIDDKTENNNAKTSLELSGIYKDKRTGKYIKIEETKDKIILYEDNKVLFEQRKYDDEGELEFQPEIFDNIVIISVGFGQTYEYATIVNKVTKEIVHKLTKISNRGAYVTYKVKNGYFFILEGNMNNESPYLYEAFSDKVDIIDMKWNCQSDDDNFCYYKYVYGVSQNYLYYATEKDVRDNKVDVRISKVDVNGKYNYSSYYEAVLCIENDYALVIKNNIMYLVDLNNNFKEYKVADYPNGEISSWHIKKDNKELYVNNWSEDITEYIFNIDTKKVSIFNEE